MANVAIKQMLKQPIVLVSLLVTCVWVLSDINSRLLPNNKQTLATDNQQNAKVLAPMRLTDTEYEFITQQYLRFAREDDSENATEQQLTAEQQLAQQGLLQQVFINDNKLTLKAVITEQGSAKKPQAVLAYALISQTHLPTGETKIVKVVNEQQIEGFTLTIFSSTQVELVRNHPQGEQRISLTMYRVADKIK